MTPYVAGVVKRLTRRIVAPLCVGSSPTTRPIFFYLKTGIPGEIGTGSLIWGYRQAVRQRTLTPLSVVRLHLPLPVIKSCRQPSAGFLHGPERPLSAIGYPLSAGRPAWGTEVNPVTPASCLSPYREIPQPSAQRAVKPKNPPVKGRSILRTFLHSPSSQPAAKPRTLHPKGAELLPKPRRAPFFQLHKSIDI